MGKENTEIFLPLSYEEYKRNKIRLLQINLKTVQSIDRLNKLRELKRIKEEQRKLLIESTKEFKKTNLY
jgi:hypothetical protein